MKNIHVLSTDKPSNLLFEKISNRYYTNSRRKENSKNVQNQNIYITSDEEIKEGDWCMYLGLSMTSFKVIEIEGDKLFYGSRESFNESLCKKIILTTDQYLIKDGVQAIDDDFLEWFVKNPSCEWVEVVYGVIRLTENDNKGYWISIPNVEFNMSIEEPKQETLEEVALNYAKQSLLVTTKDGFIAGAKWQAERMYSEEEVRHLMTLAFEQGFKKADIVEGGLEAKETDTEVNWIFLKHKK